MPNRVTNPDNQLPDFRNEGSSKISNVVYGDKSLGLAILSGDSVVVFEDQAIDKIILQPLQEQLDQQLVEFGIPGKNGNIIQATGANNKTYNWNGVIYTEDPFKTKEYLESLIVKNSPIPYRVFYMQKPIKVFVQSASFSVFDKCRIEYSMVCVEYTPPEIVSIDAQVWMDIVGDFSNAVTDPDDVEKNPCLESGKHVQGEDQKNTKFNPAKQWWENLTGQEKEQAEKELEVWGFPYGDIRNSQVFIDAMDCDFFSESENAQKKLHQVFTYLVFLIDQKLKEHGEKYLACIRKHAMDSEYQIYVDLIDEMIMDGTVFFSLPYVNQYFPLKGAIYKDGELICENLEKAISTSGIKGFHVSTKLEDVVFSDECCGDLKEGSSGNGGSGETEEYLPPRRVLCPENSNVIVDTSATLQLSEYTCWKKDGGAHAGSDTYEEIDCDSDDFKNNQDHDSYFKSYDKRKGQRMSPTSPHIIEEQKGISLSLEKGTKIYSPIDGTLVKIPTHPAVGYIQIDGKDRDGEEYSVKIYNIFRKDIVVEYRSKVKAGDLIATSGTETTIEYTINGEYFDPTICFLK
jgi:hypothetical protein